jgi:flagellar hook-length control protein FliK
MKKMIQPINMAVQIPQDSGQNRTDDAQKTGDFRSILQAAQKTKTQTDQPADKAKDIPKDTGKTEKDKKDPKEGAVSAVPADSPQAVPVQTVSKPSETTARAAADALSQIPAAAAQADKSGLTASAQRISAASTGQASTLETMKQQIPADAQTLQTQPKAAAQITAQQKSVQDVPQTTEKTAARQEAVPQSVTLQETPQDVSKANRATLPDAPEKVEGKSAVPVVQANPKIVPSAEHTGDASARKEESSRADRTDAGTQPFSDLYSAGKVLVKVSDVSGGTKASASRQVSDAVVGGLKAGKQQLQVDLYPQSLGKVSVKLVSENGVLTVEIAAANPKTQSMLASSSGEIRSILHASTGQTVQVTGQQQNAQQYTGQNGNSAQQESARQQQQQQQAEEQREARWYTAGNSSGFSTGDFLSALKSAAV